MLYLLNSGLFPRRLYIIIFIDQINIKIDSLGGYVAMPTCLNQLTSLLTIHKQLIRLLAQSRLIRTLAQKISKLLLQATQTQLLLYKGSFTHTLTVSLLLATVEATCPGWEETILSMSFIFTLATESQQQRLLRGKTIKYIAQPTFGPGLNPWGVNYLINVLPASVTFRRVPTSLYVFVMKMV